MFLEDQSISWRGVTFTPHGEDFSDYKALLEVYCETQDQNAIEYNTDLRGFIFHPFVSIMK